MPQPHLSFYILDRFSIDPDFDLLVEARQEIVFEGIRAILVRYGRIKMLPKKRKSLIYFLDYLEKAPEAQNVKVNVNLRNLGSRYAVKSYLGIPMKVMAAEDLASNKLVAFSKRTGKTNRDIYETWFFFKNNWLINHELVERRTCLPFRYILETCCRLLEEMDNRSILFGMGEVLTDKQKVWFKSKLKEDLLFQLRLYLETSR